MPLLKGKSKKAFSKNVETEMEEGKPQKQSLAIAYSMARKHKASGGTVESGDPTMNMSEGGNPYSKMEESKRSNMSQGGACPHCGSMNMSEGGMVANEQGPGVDSLPNEFDDLALRDGLEFKYTGANSGDEKGGPSKNDLVARAMLRKKR